MEEIQEYTMQEAFDKAVTGLAKQGRGSFTKGGTPAYRDGTGARCAIGMLIPDAAYKDNMEGHYITPLLGRGWKHLGFSLKGFDPGTHLASPGRFFLQDLQNVHDHNPLHLWPDMFKNIARDYGLNPDSVSAMEAFSLRDVEGSDG